MGSSLNIKTLHLYAAYDNFYNILRFCKKKYTASSQLKYHVVECFDLKTIEQKVFSKHHREISYETYHMGLSCMGKEVPDFIYVAHFGIISKERW